jgi:hypothetical protein
VQDQAMLTLSAAFTIVVNYTPLPPGVSSKSMSVPENSVPGALVDQIPNNGPSAFNFVLLTTGSSPATATTLFRVQACSGTVFVNAVRDALTRSGTHARARRSERA